MYATYVLPHVLCHGHCCLLLYSVCSHSLWALQLFCQGCCCFIYYMMLVVGTVPWFHEHCCFIYYMLYTTTYFMYTATSYMLYVCCVLMYVWTILELYNVYCCVPWALPLCALGITASLLHSEYCCTFCVLGIAASHIIIHCVLPNICAVGTAVLCECTYSVLPHALCHGHCCFNYCMWCVSATGMA